MKPNGVLTGCYICKAFEKSNFKQKITSKEEEL